MTLEVYVEGVQTTQVFSNPLDVVIAPVDSPDIIEVSTPGPQGIPGPQRMFIQPNNPSMTSPGLWIQTQQGSGNGITFWIEDGV